MNIKLSAMAVAAQRSEGTAKVGTTAATQNAGADTRNQRRMPLERSSLTPPMLATVTSYKNHAGTPITTSGASTRNARYSRPSSART